MSLKDTQRSWDFFGKTDPLFAILTFKDKKDGQWKKDEFFDTGKREVSESMNYLRSCGLGIPTGKALDFGCGVGRLTQALADYFEEVYGVDIAPSMIELAKKYNRQGNKCKYFLNGTDNLGLFPTHSFAFVYSKITLQHIAPEYSKKYIKEFLRLLKPGGLLLFQLPGEPSALMQKYPPALKARLKNFLPKFLLSAYYRIKHYFYPVVEMYGIRKEEVTKFLKENGATIIDIRPNDSAGQNWNSFQYLVKM